MVLFLVEIQEYDHERPIGSWVWMTESQVTSSIVLLRFDSREAVLKNFHGFLLGPWCQGSHSSWNSPNFDANDDEVDEFNRHT